MIVVFQRHVMKHHWKREGTPASSQSEFLCLSSGHNELSKKLGNYVLSHYGFKLDYVCTARLYYLQCTYFHVFFPLN